MKKTTLLFAVSLVGIAVCFIMTIYTGVQEHHTQAQLKSESLQVPVPVFQ